MFYYKWLNKDSNYTIIACHGTGGDENDLIPLAESLDPYANILSLRGNIEQHGLRRFFIRNQDGTFDQQNLCEQVQNLHQFLTNHQVTQLTKDTQLIGLGYSNGAMFLIAYMLLHPHAIRTYIYLHPMATLIPQNNLSLTDTQYLITYGQYDQYSTPAQIAALNQITERTSAQATFFKHDGGHEITKVEREYAASWLNQAKSKSAKVNLDNGQ